MTGQVKRNLSLVQQKISTQIESVDVTHGKIHAVLSAESEDRYKDVIRQNGWVLDNFLAHPVLLSSHDYRGLTNQIGEWQNLEIKGKGESRRLEAEGKYYVGDGNPEADWGFKLASRQRAAYSVGFQPIEYQVREGFEDEWWPPIEFTKSELLEASHVTVPAHPAALQNMLKSAHPELQEIARQQLRELAVAREKLFGKSHGGPAVDHEDAECLVKNCHHEFISPTFPVCELHAALVFAKILDGEEGEPVETETGEEEDNFFLDAIKEGLLEKGAIDAND